MAKRIVFQYFDDLDGEALNIEDLQTVEWSWAGVDYHFDTSTANLDKIEAGHVSVATLLTKSERIDKHTGDELPQTRSPRPISHTVGMCVSGQSPTTTMGWARADVSPRRLLMHISEPTELAPGVLC